MEILESLTNVEHLATAAGPDTGSAPLAVDFFAFRGPFGDGGNPFKIGIVSV